MTRRNDGRWQESLIINGKRKYFYGKTKSEILLKIREYEEEAQNGAFFRDVADEWWAQHEPTLSPNTYKSYVPALNRANAEFGDRRIKDVRPLDITRYIHSFAKTGMAQQTVKTQLMIFNLIGRYATQNGYIDSNFAREVEVPKGLSKSEREMPTSEEIEIIKQTRDTMMGRIAYWILYTGCRRSELLALTWDDVDMVRRTITINKSRYQLHGKVDVKSPKTKAGIRTIPIPDKLYETIQKGKGLVFSYNGEMWKERRFDIEWNRYRDRYGIKCSCHSLRHCYATMLYEHRVPVKVASEILGHAQTSTTQDIYTHLREIEMQRMCEELRDLDIV